MPERTCPLNPDVVRVKPPVPQIGEQTFVIHRDSFTGGETDPGAQLVDHILDVSTRKQASETSLDAFRNFFGVDQSDTPARFTNVPSVGFVGVSGVKSRDCEKNGVTNVAAETSNDGISVDVETRIIGEAAPKGCEFASILADTTQAADKTGGVFLGVTGGFTHGRQG